ncbi:amidohydrolase [Nakamurella flavida]|uniref:Amidohydrolase n=1 Tax=Nakamurella flavida TaxID=363630 RepID=A0A938YP84_9ACTN|nr:amidohydrolase family protein [Nakamurella flavida]MBM9476455.1 amidohydrolase [Nakamurella flavida]MDP9779444.1 putative TIM-barrel fold metal-dependent hydrolase [Nakamurella flavida]
MTTVLPQATRPSTWTGAVIDCDVHANVPSLDAILPYLDPVWQEATRERGWHGPTGPALSYPPGAPTTARAEWRQADGTSATRVELLQQQVLEPWRTEKAVLNCYYGVDSLRHPDWAPALARAVNDWMVAEWFAADERLVGSLVIPARDPLAAAAEIDRIGGHPQFKQVMLPVRSERLYGQRYFHPIYEVAERHDLVLGLHWGGTTEDAPSPTGYAGHYAEEYAVETQLYLAQLTSVIFEGVFQKFPTLRFAVMEGGFTWVPTWGWSMNKKWKGLRRDFPWLDRLPLDIVRDHIRFSVAPSDLGSVAQTRTILDWLGSEDILMFATDYPHRHDDDLELLLEAMPETMRPKLMAESARQWYRL